MASAFTDDSSQDKQAALAKQQANALQGALQPPKPVGVTPTIDPIAEAARRARLAALNRQGRASTMLSSAGSTITPAYSNTVLGA